MQKTYSIDSYFKDLKYMIYFYDVIIKNSNMTKENLFTELEIPYMSYIRAKEDNTNAGRNVIAKLNSYFNINDLDYSRQNEYEKTLNEIIYRFYYRGENIKEFEPILKNYINENNYLKPLFSLLLLLIKLVRINSPRIVMEENIDLYNEVKKYKGSYFVSPFKEIFTIVEIIFSNNTFVEFDREMDIEENMKGILYNVYCTNAYLSKRYDLCLYYAKECKEYLIKDNNYNRISLVNLTYFACLNMIGEYNKCFTEAKKQLIYLQQTNQTKDLIYTTEIHYYTACIGLRDYNEVIDSITQKNDYTTSDFIFLLIASSHKKNEYNSFIDKYKAERSRFTEKQDYDINTIIGYLSKKDRSLYKERLNECKISIGLKDILFRYY